MPYYMELQGNVWLNSATAFHKEKLSPKPLLTLKHPIFSAPLWERLSNSCLFAEVEDQETFKLEMSGLLNELG